ncbi:hypothetical protein LCGC14_1099180 [marine sediment metagenome]|uniref:Uncharacterized protein n=1 Tax=marine sediment metagenome TaxID=412755 RepID=A0A0F9MA46_9ZZZZ
MRCPDCNRFVSVEQGDPTEGLVLQVSDEAVTGEVRLTLLCAECNTEMAEANVEVDMAFDLEHVDECGPDELTGVQPVVALSDENATASDRYEGKGRGTRHFYGAEIEATITCQTCDAKTVVESHVEEQASSFEPVY